MPQLVKKRRSGWAVLAVGALVASILAVGAGPVSAQPAATAQPVHPTHNPEWGSPWSACVGSAGSHDAGFSDVDDDNVHAGDINCIAAYGITIGIGDGTYAPNDHVNAFQMDLFVQRAADLMGADGEAVSDAVLADVDPSAYVTRLEMAELMFGLVNDIDDDVRINPLDGQIQFWHVGDSEWVTVDDFFADAKAQVPIAESQLIGATYELGITRGTRGDGTRISTADSTFEPFANVTRAQMASFIARTLDHSNLRPAGLSFQHNSAGDSMISYRDDDFGPIADARIDVFSTLYVEDAFDEDDGECEFRFVKDETPSDSACEIDIGDQLTDDDGNIEFTPVSLAGDPITATCVVGGTVNYEFADSGSEGRTYWAWTGHLGDEVEADTDLQELENVARPVGTAGPDYARISGGLPTDDEIARMGETVTFTVQLRADTGANGRDLPNLIDDAAAGPDRSRNPYHLRIEKYFLTRVDGTDSDHGSDDGETRGGTASVSTDPAAPALFADAPGDWNYSDQGGTTVAAAQSRFQTPVDTVVWPNTDGEFTIDLTNPDLQAGTDNRDVGVRFTLTPFADGNDLITGNLLDNVVADATANDAMVIPAGTVTGVDVDVAVGYAIFSDDRSDPHNVSADGGDYRIIAGSRTGNSVTVEVVDQYGDPMRGVEISVTSNLDVAVPADATPDQVTYPEEVDITVQANEDADTNDGPGNAGDDVAPSDPLVGTESPLRHFRTRSNGAYRIGYNYTNANEAQTETITPKSIQLETVDPDNLGTNIVNREQELGIGSGLASVYWTKIGTNGGSTFGTGGALTFATVLVRDVASRTIVVHERDHANDTTTDEPTAYFYDEDDTFIIANVGATFEMFEEVMSLSIAAGDPCQVDTVMWENYTLTRASNARPGRVDRTIWEVTLTNSAG